MRILSKRHYACIACTTKLFKILTSSKHIIKNPIKLCMLRCSQYYIRSHIRYRPDATSHTRLACSTPASIHALACTHVCFTQEFTRTRVCCTQRVYPYSRVLHSSIYTHAYTYSRLALCTESVYTLGCLLRQSLSASLLVAKCIYTLNYIRSYVRA